IKMKQRGTQEWDAALRSEPRLVLREWPAQEDGGMILDSDQWRTARLQAQKRCNPIESLVPQAHEAQSALDDLTKSTGEHEGDRAVDDAVAVGIRLHQPLPIPFLEVLRDR